MKFIPLATLISALVFSRFLHAQETAPRWFEVEVIFFKQLKQTELKENFLDEKNLRSLPSYPNTIDLFTPALTPDIASLKAMLPVCGSAQPQASEFEYANYLPAMHPLKTSEILNETRHLSQVKSQFSQAAISPTPADFAPSITQGELASVKQAQQFFSKIQFKDYQDQPYKTNQGFCQIPEQQYMQRVKIDEQASYNELPVAEVPAVLSGPTQGQATPYLVKQQDFQLGEIYQQLKNSPNFKPLLHFAWRLPPQTQKKAEGYTIFAGDNYQHIYQQAIQNKQTQQRKQHIAELQQTLAQDNLIVKNAPNVAHPDKALSSIEDNVELNEQAIREQDILSHKNLISELALQGHEYSLNQLQRQLDNSDNSLSFLTKNAPNEIQALPPTQPWYLNGVMRIHLDHYLYITADFNVIKESVDEYKHSLTTPKATPLTLIPFEQNRRVISSEIHYFDHPYMGMIVQIRKHDPLAITPIVD